jgi:uncharacterized hydrophobic protein (TIGR00271 family)
MQIVQFLQRLIHPMAADEKKHIIADISQSATSSFDFFLLVVLSCSIATLGLITNSPAVIIGAMLVAPLMSPIIGIGLASIMGDAGLVRKSATALLRGAGLAILLSSLMTLVNARLPFVVLQELPAEVLARTHPSPIDLVIALAGGLAAAYALTRPNISAALPGVAIATALMPPLCTVGIGLALARWDVAGGATLLFITNAITIAFAAALVFFLRGFAPETHLVNHQPPRTLVVSAVITLILLVPLTYYSVQFFQQANENRLINEVVTSQVSRIKAELVELIAGHTSNGLDMVITVRTTSPLRYEQVVALQQGIVDGLHQSVSLKVNQIFAEQLDPLIPPTPTLTPTMTLTYTPGPSPTITPSPTFTPTVTFTSTATATFTATPTNTPTPELVQVLNTALPRLQLYQSPNGPVIGQIRPGQKLTLLYGRQEVGGLVWVEVMDVESRIGWIPEVYLRLVTATPSQ